MKNDGYNGWKNYETWAVALWIDNDQGLYDERLDRVETGLNTADSCDQVDSGIWTQDQANRFCVSDALRFWVRDELAPDLGASLWADLLNASLESVDWHELADHWIPESQENEA